MKFWCLPLLLLLVACDGDVDYTAEADPSLSVPPPTRAAMEHCFGIAPAGKGAGPHGPDTSEVDFQGDASMLVKAGTCKQTVVAAKDGQARRGSLKPLWRDRPVGPWMDAEDVTRLRAAQKAEAEQLAAIQEQADGT